MERAKHLIVVFPVLGLMVGFGLRQAGMAERGTQVWAAATLVVLAVLVVEIVTTLRRGETGLDIVAALSMAAALTFGETLAAIVVALMYAGGSYLEGYAEGRARREMRDLLNRVPRSAMRFGAAGLEEVAIADILVGDRLLVRTGDVTAVDGTVAEGRALLDQSALTGEAMPAQMDPGGPVMSGATNVGDAFQMTAAHLAADSTYAGIVRLVEAAQKSRAPMSRMADRYAMGFLLVTVLLAGAAWLLTGDPVRAVAVLVVATPCPLILAVPVALVSGLSRAARYGVLIKGASALETMAGVRVAVLDKTGTLTDGRPQVVSVDVAAGGDARRLLGLAASLEQASKHPMAQALIAGARDRGIALSLPEAVRETSGQGLAGVVGGREVVVGGAGFVRQALADGGGAATWRAAAGEMAEDGAATVHVAVDGMHAGVIVLADRLRPGMVALLGRMRETGIARIVLATGDRADVARAVTAGLGLDAVEADLTPERKLRVVADARAFGPVMMVGDGVNDAPALAASDVGVAMGARGAAASAEAADVVLMVDDLGRLLPGLQIAQGARRIAVESVVVGIGLSVLGMVAAALGYLTPVQGALLQELIDVAVIVNALRVLRLTPDMPVAEALAELAVR